MKVCWVAIIGRPNVGKSSLLNELLDYDLAIVSPVAQTTRDQILGVYSDPEYQIIFTDTPGIHKPQSKFGESLNQRALDTIKNNDVVLFLQPANQEISKGDEMILEKLNTVENKIAIITKIDTIKDPTIIMEKVDQLKQFNFKSIISTTIKAKESVQALMEELKTFAYEDNPYYEMDYITDRSQLFLSKEIIRSCAIDFLREELPHSIAVEITKYDLEEENNKTFIEATIYCKKDSQKGMIIGKQGSMIKKIGTNARIKIADQFGTNVDLRLDVKVNKNWIDDEKVIKKFGY